MASSKGNMMTNQHVLDKVFFKKQQMQGNNNMNSNQHVLEWIFSLEVRAYCLGSEEAFKILSERIEVQYE